MMDRRARAPALLLLAVVVLMGSCGRGSQQADNAGATARTQAPVQRERELAREARERASRERRFADFVTIVTRLMSVLTNAEAARGDVASYSSVTHEELMKAEPSLHFVQSHEESSGPDVVSAGVSGSRLDAFRVAARSSSESCISLLTTTAAESRGILHLAVRAGENTVKCSAQSFSRSDYMRTDWQ